MDSFPRGHKIFISSRLQYFVRNLLNPPSACLIVIERIMVSQSNKIITAFCLKFFLFLLLTTHLHQPKTTQPQPKREYNPVISAKHFTAHFPHPSRCFEWPYDNNKRSCTLFGRRLPFELTPLTCTERQHNSDQLVSTKQTFTLHFHTSLLFFSVAQESNKTRL